MSFLRKHTVLTASLPAIAEAGCILAAFALALTFARWPLLPFWEAAAVQAWWPVLLMAAWYSQAIDHRLYVSRRSDALIPQLTDVVKAMFTAVLMTLFFMAVLKPFGIDRRFALTFTGSAVFLVLVFRLVARLSLWGLRGRSFNDRRIILVGTNERTLRLAEVILANEHYGFHIEGFLEDDPDRQDFLEAYDIPYLGNIQTLETMLTDKVVDVVYVTLPLRSHYETVQDITHLCEGIGVQVRLVGEIFFAEKTTCEIERLGETPLLSFSAPSLETQLNIQRLAQWPIRLFLLLFLSPVLGFITLLLRMESREPVLVTESHVDPRSQQRIDLLRFRTSKTATDADGQPVASPSRIGALLRRFSLHEVAEILGGWRGPSNADASESDAENAPAKPSVQKTPFLWVLVLLDILSMTSAFCWAAWHALPWDISYGQFIVQHALFLPIFVLLWFVAAIDQRLFRHWRISRLQTYIFAIIKAVGTALVISVVAVGLAFKGTVESEFLLSFSVATPITLFVLRLGFRLGVQYLHRLGFFMRQALIVGSNERAVALASTLSTGPRSSYTVKAFLEDDPERVALLEAQGLTHLGGTDQLNALLDSGLIHAVYVCLPTRSFYEEIQRMVGTCASHGIPMAILADLFRLRVAQNRPMYIDDVPVLSLSSIPETRFRMFLKRLMDLTVSTLMLIPLLPVFAFVGILIKLDSKGTVFFKQERIGQNQRRFKMIKFRTMVANAEALRAALEAQNEADGPVFKIKKDPRLTRIGGFMRKHSLDEFPQLINVWKGEMSLVGPRPPLQNEVEKYTWSQRRRLSVRPGMTGLWQVSGRSDLEFDEWVALDLEYIDTWSISLDFIILFKTFKEVFYGRGAS